PVLAEMDRDAVRARGLREPRGLQWIGLVGVAGLPHGGHMVDVDVQTLRRHCSGLRSRLTSLADTRQRETRDPATVVCDGRAPGPSLSPSSSLPTAGGS